MMLSIKPLNQQDKKWASEKLGDGIGSIKNYGCLLVSYTMLLNYFGIKRTPFQVNEEMKNAGGYTGKTKNLWVWAIADRLFPTNYQGSFTWNNNKVLNWINKNVPVIVKVDGKPIGGLSHYVVAIGGGKIADPFTGTIEPFSKYKPLGYHVYTYFLEGEPMNNDALEVCLKQHTELVEEAEEFKNTISKQASELTKYKKDEKSLIDKLETAGDKLISVEALKEKWHNLYKQSQKNNDSLKLDNTTFQTKITKIQQTSFETAETKVIFLALVKRILNIKREVVVKDGTNKEN